MYWVTHSLLAATSAVPLLVLLKTQVSSSEERVFWVLLLNESMEAPCQPLWPQGGMGKRQLCVLLHVQPCAPYGAWLSIVRHPPGGPCHNHSELDARTSDQ